MKWVIEFKEHDIEYCSCKALKEEALANFLLEMTIKNVESQGSDVKQMLEETHLDTWKMYINGFSAKGQCR